MTSQARGVIVLCFVYICVKYVGVLLIIVQIR